MRITNRPGLNSLSLAFSTILLSSAVDAAPRDVQFVNIDFDAGVVELRNLGTTTEPLAGWRFCSHNTSLERRYSSTSGLNAVSIAPGESIFIHYNGDAAAANEFNTSSLGGAFAPLERDAYAIQIYFPPISFSNGNTIADHLQWSVGGVSNSRADARNVPAQNGGLWLDQTDWISIATDTDLIRLTDLDNNVQHSSADYALGDPEPPTPPTPPPAGINVPLAPIGVLAAFATLLMIVGWKRNRH